MAVRQEERSGVRRRTRRALLDAAAELIAEGQVPTVADAAARADVSRATAYRYFSSQADLIETLGEERMARVMPPALEEIEADEPLQVLFGHGLVELKNHEALMRAALRASLEQWGKPADRPAGERPVVRGGRIALVHAALDRADPPVPEEDRRRLAVALSLVFGIEAWIVLKDIWHLDDDEAESILRWTADVLLGAHNGPR